MNYPMPEVEVHYTSDGSVYVDMVVHGDKNKVHFTLSAEYEPKSHEWRVSIPWSLESGDKVLLYDGFIFISAAGEREE